RYVAVGCARHVHHVRAARLLGVPDLCVGGKLEVAHHDLVAPAGEIQSAGERVDACGGGGGHRDLVGTRPEHSRHGDPHRLVLRHPHVPVRADQQPVVHVGVDSLTHTLGQRTVGAAVEI